jgi:hypothetical protein
MKPNPATVAVAAAPVLLIVLAAAVLTAALFGYQPLWPDAAPTLSEAIVVRDLGALSRALEARPDMQRRYSVRAGMVTDRDLELTPFEAVIAAKRDDVMSFLAARGIVPVPAEVRRLRCLAAASEAADVLRLLGGPSADRPCSAEDSRAPW